MVLQLMTMMGVTFALSLLITPVIRAGALRWGLVDAPDGRRKIQARPIPVAGGVAVFLAATIALVGAMFLSADREALLADSSLVYLGLFGASAIIASVGVIDDTVGLRGRHKLIGQFLAITVLVVCGLRIDNIGAFGYNIPLGILAIPFTYFWFLGAINSLNLIDGMDGMLGTVGAIITFTIGCIALYNEQFVSAYIAFSLSGAILGFLWFNFPPATIYLGDCGSMLIGLVIGALAIQCSLKGPATVALSIPISLLVIPIFDSSAAIIRRKLTGRSIYATDRGHMHHVLMKSGLSNRRVLLLVSSLSALAGLGTLGSLWLKNEFVAILAAVAVVLTLIASKLFGHAEFLLMKERLKAVFYALRHGSKSGSIREIEIRLQGSASWNELWPDLTAVAQQMNLKMICLDLNAPSIHEGYHARWDRQMEVDAENPAIWRAEIPLYVNQQTMGRLEVMGVRDHESIWDKLAHLAKIGENVEAAIAHLSAGNEPSSASKVHLLPSAVRLHKVHSA